MQLTRRDAAAALAALGAGGAVAFGAERIGRSAPGDPASDSGSGSRPSDERLRTTLVAAADVIYPSDVSGVEAFVEGFLDGRLDRSEHASGLRNAVGKLDDRAVSWHGDRFAALSAADRDRLLREIGADTAEEDPDGTAAERIRYYVVNELLLALYASPTGGELVGLENPQGHPGGTESYRRRPP
ncbi:MAG: hypothetical protein ACI9TI_001982 [Natronomonas sp.]|jgi:hypothetical protein|uniref:gluconate 2-dehydrogenase subunit 3 family protein n=1 Tax=Natronomonas sp. TaxID=2184060 RepID=UPI003989A006